MREKELEKLKDYKYGFTTDIENIKSPKGLNEEVIKFISNIKKEPAWMLNWRLKAFERLKVLKEPNWQKPKYPKIDYQDLYYYSAPKSASDKPKNLEDLAKQNQMGLVMLKVIEIIGEDDLKDLDPETIYFLNRILNELNLKKIRNNILREVLPLKV